jgi:glucose-6-phosphate isomerase
MEGLPIKFAFGGALGCRGIKFRRIGDEYSELCAAAANWLEETQPSVSGHGWIGLPDTDTADIKDAAEWLKKYDSIIHVGIGGSALGNLMLNQALLNEYHNESSAPPRFYLADNPDPSKADAIWQQVKSGRVALVGVSKSGATAETMSQFLWFRRKMSEKNADVSKDILVITDPEKGIFRSFARATGCRAIDLPQSVGGRYSVLSSAGLVSAAALDIDIDALLSGARRMREALFEKKSFYENPAWIMAALSLYHEGEGRPMSVMMPYSSKLAYFTEWYAQLWGESLGKEGKGTTPIRALGAIDQHSQVQLYTEGPDDKLFTIINLNDHGRKVMVPPVDIEVLSPLSYLDNADIGKMLGLEAMSTAAAIIKSGHPVIWIEIGSLAPSVLGALIFFYEYVTAITGRMMAIDPFDQPGVEQGKKYTYGLMGRSGYEKDAEEAKEWFNRIGDISIGC